MAALDVTGEIEARAVTTGEGAAGTVTGAGGGGGGGGCDSGVESVLLSAGEGEVADEAVDGVACAEGWSCADGEAATEAEPDTEGGEGVGASLS